MSGLKSHIWQVLAIVAIVILAALTYLLSQWDKIMPLGPNIGLDFSLLTFPFLYLPIACIIVLVIYLIYSFVR